MITPDLILENERVRLEPLEERHISILAKVALDKALWLYTSAKINSFADYEKYMNTALQEKENNQAFPFVVFDKISQSYAGSTRFGSFSWENKRLEIGWTWYGTSYQGTGITKQCKFLLLSYGFENLDLNRIELKTSLLNEKSQRAMLRIGAVKEGILRRHIINDDGTLRDSVYFSFIKEEWPGIQDQYFSEFLKS